MCHMPLFWHGCKIDHIPFACDSLHWLGKQFKMESLEVCHYIDMLTIEQSLGRTYYDIQ